MKTLLKAFPIGLLGSLSAGIVSAVAGLEVSATVQINAAADFYEPLAPNGAWVEVGSYGRCWHPAHVEVDWRPYCYGSWVWTDCGWYWQSDEPWAWACYHYGSWVYDPTYAWIWVPGIEWAPAWVSWRVGGGYVGWSPLPPHGGFAFRAEVAAPAPFVFVEMNHFHERMMPSTVIVNNTTIINKTTQINNIREETKSIGGAGPRKVMVNEGPGLQPIQQATAKKVRVVSINEAVRQTPVPAAVRRTTTEPKAPEPKTIQPKTTQPNTVEPRAIEPKTIQPKTVEPKPIEPKTTLPRENPEKKILPPNGNQAPKPVLAPKVEPQPKPAPPPKVEPLPKAEPPTKVEPLPKVERPPRVEPTPRVEPPARGEIRPLPERPVTPSVPPVVPHPPLKEKHEGKGHEKERP